MEQQVTRNGYKQTDLGEIPEDWEVIELLSVANLIHGKAHEPFVVEAGDYTVVNAKFVSTEGKVRKTCSQNICPARKRDVLMVLSDLPNGRALAKCYLVTEDKKYAVNQRVCIYRATKIDPTFLRYKINRHHYFLSLDDGVTQTHILNGDIAACRIFAPKDQYEQTIIANALSDVGSLITSLEKLIGKKRAIKTATMQQLLIGKTRLPGFDKHPDGKPKGLKQTELGEIPEDWEVALLEDVGEPIIGLTYSPADVSDSGTLVLRSSNVQENKLSFNDNVFVQMDVPDRVTVRKGDILVCVRNGSKRLIGKCALIDEKTDGEAFGAFMSIFRSPVNEFVFYQFQSNIIQAQIDQALGATINQITNKDMNAFKIPLPLSRPEQTAIADLLSDMDEELDVLAQRLNKTQQIKQGMMQELLTGRTRLV
jgi:type I restriction enzyme, S subunit